MRAPSKADELQLTGASFQAQTGPSLRGSLLDSQLFLLPVMVLGGAGCRQYAKAVSVHEAPELSCWHLPSVSACLGSKPDGETEQCDVPHAKEQRKWGSREAAWDA